jgi:hypothetical protein
MGPEVCNKDKGQEVILDLVIPCHSNRGHNLASTQFTDFLRDSSPNGDKYLPNYAAL